MSMKFDLTPMHHLSLIVVAVTSTISVTTLVFYHFDPATITLIAGTAGYATHHILRDGRRDRE